MSLGVAALLLSYIAKKNFFFENSDENRMFSAICARFKRAQQRMSTTAIARLAAETTLALLPSPHNDNNSDIPRLAEAWRALRAPTRLLVTETPRQIDEALVSSGLLPSVAEKAAMDDLEQALASATRYERVACARWLALERGVSFTPPELLWTLMYNVNGCLQDGRMPTYRRLLFVLGLVAESKRPQSML